jgi:hypothetical protein
MRQTLVAYLRYEQHGTEPAERRILRAYRDEACSELLCQWSWFENWRPKRDSGRRGVSVEGLRYVIQWLADAVAT